MALVAHVVWCGGKLIIFVKNNSISCGWVFRFFGCHSSSFCLPFHFVKAHELLYVFVCMPMRCVMCDFPHPHPTHKHTHVSTSSLWMQVLTFTHHFNIFHQNLRHSLLTVCCVEIRHRDSFTRPNRRVHYSMENNLLLSNFELCTFDADRSNRSCSYVTCVSKHFEVFSFFSRPPATYFYSIYFPAFRHTQNVQKKRRKKKQEEDWRSWKTPTKISIFDLTECLMHEYHVTSTSTHRLFIFIYQRLASNDFVISIRTKSNTGN